MSESIITEAARKMRALARKDVDRLYHTHAFAIKSAIDDAIVLQRNVVVELREPMHKKALYEFQNDFVVETRYNGIASTHPYIYEGTLK